MLVKVQSNQAFEMVNGNPSEQLLSEATKATIHDDGAATAVMFIVKPPKASLQQAK